MSAERARCSARLLGSVERPSQTRWNASPRSNRAGAFGAVADPPFPTSCSAWSRASTAPHPAGGPQTPRPNNRLIFFAVGNQAGTDHNGVYIATDFNAQSLTFTVTTPPFATR